MFKLQSFLNKLKTNTVHKESKPKFYWKKKGPQAQAHSITLSTQ